MTHEDDDAEKPEQKATVVRDSAVVAGPKVRKKDLMDRVAALSGQKRNQAKPVVEATLDALGAALAEGEELDLPPFGKLRVVREKTRANGRVFTCRISQPAAAPPSGPAADLVKDPLAEPGEDG